MASLFFGRAVESGHAGGLSVDECCQYEVFAGTETKPGGPGLRSGQSVGAGLGGKKPAARSLGLEGFETEMPEWFGVRGGQGADLSEFSWTAFGSVPVVA